MKKEIIAILFACVCSVVIGVLIGFGTRLFLEFNPNPPLVVEHRYHYNIQDATFDKEVERYLDLKQKEK